MFPLELPILQMATVGGGADDAPGGPRPGGHLPADGGLTVKVLYTAAARPSPAGATPATAATSDGALDVQLRAPAELGGEGGGTNPEQLFAVGYAACFEGAIKTIARREKLDADAVAHRLARSASAPADDRSFTIAVGLDVTLPGFDDDQAPSSSCAPRTRSAPTRTRRAATSTSTLTANGRPVED